jgi:hypothetical protein
MFQPRRREFDPRIAALKGHLRAIERELDSVGRRAPRSDAARSATAGNQIAEAIVPILSQIVDHFGRGQSVAANEAANFGREAATVGTKIGSGALKQIATQTKKHPLIILAAAAGVGLLIGIANRRR